MEKYKRVLNQRLVARPASSDEETIKKLIQNSMNIARINFSHSSFESHQKVINLLRQTAKSLNKRIVILGEFIE
jgi:pyruvate kinase (EC 2.7.1.40)